MHALLPQDRLQPIGSSCQHPSYTDVTRKTYGCFGHGIRIGTWRLAADFSKRITVYAQKVIFWLSMLWAPYFHAGCHCTQSIYKMDAGLYVVYFFFSAYEGYQCWLCFVLAVLQEHKWSLKEGKRNGKKCLWTMHTGKLMTPNKITFVVFSECCQTWCCRHVQAYTRQLQLSSLNGIHVRSKASESQREFA